MKETNQAKRYHVKRFITGASIEELEKWALDPSCAETEECANLLIERREEREKFRAKRDAARAAQLERLSERRKELEANPFDARTEVSADAKHIASRIVTHLWILFILVPVIIAVLLIVLGIVK
jgi:hypothetical protein